MSRFSVDRLSVLKKGPSGRLSMLLNEDDYDYALELRPDDEYRQAAEALPKLVDFDDIDLSELCMETETHLVAKENATVLPFSAQNSEYLLQSRRQSNFDRGMLELHHNTGKGRKSLAHVRDSMAAFDDGQISHWGAVNGAPTGNNHSLTTRSADDGADCDFESSGEDGEEHSSEHPKYDRRITGMGTGPLSADALAQGAGLNFNATTGSSSSGDSSFSSKWKRLSKKEFSFRLNMLEKHRKWVERAARRSSIGFHRHHPSSDKEAMDKFLVAMAGGVHVRRHQAYRLSEVVRLYSVTGCRTIEWDKPKARDLLAQRRRQGVHADGATNAIINTAYDKSAFDCCIAICGCGDDLNAGHDAHAQSDAPNMYNEDTREDVRYNSFGRSFYNLGYRRRGTFRDLDVLAVHPAGKEDPTMVGMLGTECLRRTKDAFNTELTFSVVVRDTTSAQGYSTLDVECESADLYYLLLRGFRLLQEEAEAHRAQQRHSGGSGNQDGESDYDLEAGDRSSRSLSSRVGSALSGSLLQAQRIEELSALWNSVKGYVTGGAWEKGQAPQDPISELFAPSSQLDPLRALRVGGGLLPANSTPLRAAAGGSSAINSPASPQSPSLLPEGSAVQTNSLPVAQFLGWKSAGTQIWARLKMAGLDVKCVLSWDLKRVILKIRCPAWRLEQMAEQMHLKLKSRDGYLKQFKVSRRDTFVAMGNNGAMFRSSERQQIIDYIIRSKIKDGGAELDENTELGKQVVQRFPLHMYSKLADIQHSWVTFWKREHFGQEKVGWSPFSESYAVTYGHIKSATQHFFGNLLTQPLDSIAEYFGESIAFYFAYMAFYTRWLVFPSVLGVIVFACQLADNRLDHWICPLYAVVVMLWACFMLAFWRQKASALAHRWGVLDYEVEETERPQFRGDYTYDESSGEVRKTYSLWKRMAKYLVSIPVLSCAILVTLVVMTTVFYSQDHMYNDYVYGRPIDFSPQFPSFSAKHSSAAVNVTAFGTTSNATTAAVPVKDHFALSDLQNSSFWAGTFFYPSMYGILVSLLTIVFEFVALWLNDYENHRTQTTYLNRLILKVFSFQFVTIFTSLYYYAFFTDSNEGAFYQISVTIFSLMTMGQWWSVILDIAVPALYHRALLYRMKSAYANTNRKIYRAREYADAQSHKAEASASKRNRRAARSLAAVMNEKLDKRADYLEQAKSKCWEEALQARYNNFADYTSMVIQIGFVLFFSSVFPLCPLIALLNNLALIRLNALKICYTRQRPIAQKIGGIGVWEDVIQIMSVGGILTNCALYGFTSSVLKDALFPSVGKTGMAIFLFAYEHAILLFKYWLHSSIPTVHPSVQRARSRERKSCDRKSLLRSQAAKSRRRSTVAGAGSGGGGNDGGGNGGQVQGTEKKQKPLRAKSSLMGFWFDMSTRVAGMETTEGEEDDAYCGGGGDIELTRHESHGLLADSTQDAHRVDYNDGGAGGAGPGYEEYDPPSGEDEEDELPPPPDSPPPRSLARRLLEDGDEEDESSVDLAYTCAGPSPQPPHSHTPSPLNLSDPDPATASRPSMKPIPRRSLSPSRSPLQHSQQAQQAHQTQTQGPFSAPSPIPMPMPAPFPMPVTRDEMISMIHANISNSLVGPPPLLINAAAAAPVPTGPSRRVSFAEAVVTSQPRAPSLAPAQYFSQPGEAGDGAESEEDFYEDYDEEVSDLSEEDVGDEEWDEQAAGRYDNLTPLSAAAHHKQRGQQQATPAGRDAWRMSFGEGRANDPSGRQGARSGQVKYSPLQLQQPAQSGAPGPVMKQAKTLSAKSAGPKSRTQAVKQPPPTALAHPTAVGNVQNMISNWIWGPASAGKGADKHGHGAGRHGALNLAPLGQGKKPSTPAGTAPKHAPFSPPITSPQRFEEATSPYAALLTPPVTIAPPSGSPRPQPVGQSGRDASPRGSATPTAVTAAVSPRTASPSPMRAKQPKQTGPATPPRPFLAEQVTSPFSYTGYTPDVTPSRSAPARSPAAVVNQENERILANLQTGQLQQLLLLQQQQQQQAQQHQGRDKQSPTPQRKKIIAGTPLGADSSPSRACNNPSPARSALAGGRKLQQQLLSTQMQALGWQPAANPYEHIISPGGSARHRDSVPAPPLATPPAASAQTPSAGRRRQSVVMGGPAGPGLEITPSAGARGRTAATPTPGSGRRGSRHMNTPGGAAAGAGAGAGDVPSGMAPAANPFSFAAAKRPSRVQYD